jgi:hypothetical protein
MLIGATHTAPVYPSTNVRSQSFSNGPINLLCIKLGHMFTLGLPLSNLHVTWILTVQNFAVIPVYNSIDMERCLVREACLAEEIGCRINSLSLVHSEVCACYSVLVPESFEPCTLLGRPVCVAHHALLNMEFITAS